MPPLSGGQQGVPPFVHPNALNQRLTVTPPVVTSNPGSVRSSSPSTADSGSSR